MEFYLINDFYHSFIHDSHANSADEPVDRSRCW
jgi:hypothetical protein